MPTFVYTKKAGKTKINGGRTLTFTAYQLRPGKQPKLLGVKTADSRWYKGDIGTVRTLIAEKMHYRMSDEYHIKRKDIKIYEID